MVSKRGAIELSMTTIIVIIVGVVLLSLGLMWVKSIFGSVQDLTDQSLLTADSVIQNEMAPSDTFYISGYSIDAKQDKLTEIYAGVQFFDVDPQKMGTFTLDIDDGGNTGLEWVATKVIARAGERKGIPFGVIVPKNIAKGTTYSVTVTVNLNNQFYESEAFLLEIV